MSAIIPNKTAARGAKDAKSLSAGMPAKRSFAKRAKTKVKAKNTTNISILENLNAGRILFLAMM